jgi:sulfite dehydrogenase (cytochrome) subunit A
LPVTFSAGPHDIKVRATNQAGQIQPDKPRWNPPGYMRNVIETTSVTAA